METRLEIRERGTGFAVDYLLPDRSGTLVENLSHRSTAFGMVLEAIRRLQGHDVVVVDLPDGSYLEWVQRPRKPNVPGSWPIHRVRRP